jgi:hypothetical protein
MKDAGFFNAELPYISKTCTIFAIHYPIEAMPNVGRILPQQRGKEIHMATIVVKDRNGRPVANAQVTANTVTKYAWGDYNLTGKTDENGVCELLDRNERYRLFIEGIGVKTVEKLRNVIHLLSPG